MHSVEILIAAYAEEDRRLLELARQCPPARREERLVDSRMSLLQTLGHLAFWDDYTVGFFEARCENRDVTPLTLQEFEDRNQNELNRLCGLPFEEALETYQAATRALVRFLREHWDDLTDKDRGNFSIPLKHRRHHRRKLRASLEAWRDDAAEEKAG